VQELTRCRHPGRVTIHAVELASAESSSPADAPKHFGVQASAWVHGRDVRLRLAWGEPSGALNVEKASARAAAAIEAVERELRRAGLNVVPARSARAQVGAQAPH
jgi:hypothetical protein